MRGPTATTRTPGTLGGRAAIPLAQRQVGDLVPVGRQPLGEVAVPALGAADGVGEQAVVDEADAHGGGRQTDRYVSGPIARDLVRAHEHRRAPVCVSFP